MAKYTKKEAMFITFEENREKFEEEWGDDYKEFREDCNFFDVIDWLFEQPEAPSVYSILVLDEIPCEMENIFFLEEEQVFVYLYR